MEGLFRVVLKVAKNIPALEGPGGVLRLGSSFVTDALAHGSPNSDELTQEISR